MSSSDSSVTDSEEEKVVPAKKAKTSKEDKNGKKKPKKAVTQSSNEDEESSGEKPTKEKKASTTKTKDEPGKDKSVKDGNGNEIIPLGGTRFVSVERFKGRLLISIREYYQKDGGQWFPTKKGVTLSQDQFEMLKKIVPEIEEKIKST